MDPVLFLISSSLVHSVDLYKTICRALVKEIVFLTQSRSLFSFSLFTILGIFQRYPNASLLSSLIFRYRPASLSILYFTRCSLSIQLYTTRSCWRGFYNLNTPALHFTILCPFKPCPKDTARSEARATTAYHRPPPPQPRPTHPSLPAPPLSNKNTTAPPSTHPCPIKPKPTPASRPTPPAAPSNTHSPPTPTPPQPTTPTRSPSHTRTPNP